MKSLFLALGLTMVGTACVFAGCPAAVDRSEELKRLRAHVQAAETEMEGRIYDRQMWEIWTTAPDAKAQELLDAGMRSLRVADYDAALAELDALVAYCPDYAEGWNQRAFVHFLRQDYDAALADLDRTLGLNPDHTGALSGKALSLIGMGRVGLAQDTLRRAVALNPWLPERRLLTAPPGAPL
ncbi:tetratricopeptide repeat protein [Tropicimonas sp. S265A]|uniref:tetratricopeptide repeat protein n=1 Tax=Tropicimonas sp. S265A TaxID=3415134 RepID=UPI003C79852E